TGDGILRIAPADEGGAASPWQKGRGLPRPFVSAADGPNRLAVADPDIVARVRAVIELARAADLFLRIGDHFLPLGNPAHRAGHGEDRREHRGGEANGVENDA